MSLRSATAFGGNFNKAALVLLTLTLPFLQVRGREWAAGFSGGKWCEKLGFGAREKAEHY
jgi:hypothetical protein